MTSPQRFDQTKYRQRRPWGFRASELLLPGGGPAIVGDKFHGRDGGPFTWVRAGSALYVDAARRYGSAVDDRPRIHMVTDPVSGDLVPSLLHEPANTNLLLHNRDPSNAAWDRNNASIVLAQNAVGIKGEANKAWTVTDGDGGASLRIGQSFTVANDSETHRAAVFIRKDSNEARFPMLIMELVGGTTVDASVRFNTATGAVNERGGTSVPVVTDAGDFWRLSIQVANNTSGNTTLRVDFYPAWSSSFTSDVNTTGSAVYDFGQVEKSTVSSSPIETGAAAVARPTDQVTADNPLTPAMIQAAGGLSVYLDVIDPHAALAVENGRTLVIGTTGTVNTPANALRLDTRLDRKLGVVVSVGGSFFLHEGGVMPDGARVRAVMRVEPDGAQYRVRLFDRFDDAAWVDRGTTSAFDLWTAFTGSKIALGSRGDGVVGMHGRFLAGGITLGVQEPAALEEEFR